MMPRWHHSDSSKAMSTAEPDSVKKKTLELNSRSNLFSAGLDNVELILKNYNLLAKFDFFLKESPYGL